MASSGSGRGSWRPVTARVPKNFPPKENILVDVEGVVKDINEHRRFVFIDFDAPSYADPDWKRYPIRCLYLSEHHLNRRGSLSLGEVSLGQEVSLAALWKDKKGTPTWYGFNVRSRENGRVLPQPPKPPLRRHSPTRRGNRWQPTVMSTGGTRNFAPIPDSTDMSTFLPSSNRCPLEAAPMLKQSECHQYNLEGIVKVEQDDFIMLELNFSNRRQFEMAKIHRTDFIDVEGSGENKRRLGESLFGYFSVNDRVRVDVFKKPSDSEWSVKSIHLGQGTVKETKHEDILKDLLISQLDKAIALREESRKKERSTDYGETSSSNSDSAQTVVEVKIEQDIGEQQPYEGYGEEVATENLQCSVPLGGQDKVGGGEEIAVSVVQEAFSNVEGNPGAYEGAPFEPEDGAENEDAAAQDVEGHDSRAQHAGSHNDTAQDAEHHCGAGQGGDLGTGKETENGGARPKDEKEELCASEDRDIRAITSIEVSDTVKLLIEVRVKIEAVNQRTKM